MPARPPRVSSPPAHLDELMRAATAPWGGDPLPGAPTAPVTHSPWDPRGSWVYPGSPWPTVDPIRAPPAPDMALWARGGPGVLTRLDRRGPLPGWGVPVCHVATQTVLTGPVVAESAAVASAARAAAESSAAESARAVAAVTATASAHAADGAAATAALWAEISRLKAKVAAMAATAAADRERHRAKPGGSVGSVSASRLASRTGRVLAVTVGGSEGGTGTGSGATPAVVLGGEVSSPERSPSPRRTLGAPSPATPGGLFDATASPGAPGALTDLLRSLPPGSRVMLSPGRYPDRLELTADHGALVLVGNRRARLEGVTAGLGAAATLDGLGIDDVMLRGGEVIFSDCLLGPADGVGGASGVALGGVGIGPTSDLNHGLGHGLGHGLRHTLLASGGHHRLRRCRIGGYGGGCGLHIVPGPPGSEIARLEMDDCDVCDQAVGLEAWGGEALITRCRFRRNDRAMTVGADGAEGGDLTVIPPGDDRPPGPRVSAEGCTFDDSVGPAVEVGETGRLVLISCVVSSGSTGVALTSPVSATLTSCTIRDCGVGISLWHLPAPAADAPPPVDAPPHGQVVVTITGNTVSGCTGAGILLGLGAAPLLSGNVSTGNGQGLVMLRGCDDTGLGANEASGNARGDLVDDRSSPGGASVDAVLFPGMPLGRLLATCLPVGGGTVLLAPGEYQLTRPLALAPPLGLVRLLGRGEATLVGAGAGGCIISTGGGSVEGLALMCRHPGTPVVTIAAGTLTLVDCEIRGGGGGAADAGGDGVLVTGGRPELTRCRLSKCDVALALRPPAGDMGVAWAVDQTAGAVAAVAAGADVNDCSFFGNVIGVLAEGGGLGMAAEASLLGCTFADNATGATARGQGAGVTASACDVFGCDAGLAASGGGRLLASQVAVRGGRVGIDASGEGTSASLTDCDVSNCEVTGARAEGGAEVGLERCGLEGSAIAIAVAGVGTKARLERCGLGRSSQCGVLAREGAAVHLIDCTVTGNAVGVLTNEAAVTLGSADQIRGNAEGNWVEARTAEGGEIERVVVS